MPVDFTPLRILRNLGRTRQVVAVLLNHGFGDVVDRMGLTRTYHRWRRWLFRHPAVPVEQTTSRPERVRRVLEDLGPTFVKFGQVISTRPDLIPRPYLRELERLQEHVPPFPGAQARAIILEEFGEPVETLFKEFSTEPLAAGSLGQVHEARLHDGTRVAVKIRRPGAVRDIERDLSLLDQLALLLVRNFPETEVFDPVGLVGQFARSIRRELQFSREGRTMDEFRRRFVNDATVQVPEVYWNQTSDAVLTVSFVDGCRINDRDALSVLGIEPARIADHGARVFLKMVFELGLFHGDPHPGNLRVMPDGSLGLLDYGLVGRLEPDKRDQLVDLLAAVARGDVRNVVLVLREIGRPFRPVDESQLAADVRDFLESFYGLPLERIAIGQLLGDFVGILTTHGIRYPVDLMLLIRAIVTLEGVGRDLDPGFNLARLLQPYIESRIRERFRPDEMGARVWREAQMFGRVAYRIPGHVERILDKLSSDSLHVQFEHQNLERLITEVDKAGNRLVIGLVMSALIVSSAMVLRSGGGTDTTWWLTVPAFLLSSLLGIWLIYGVFRSGRL